MERRSNPPATVPDVGTGDREGPGSDCRQAVWRHNELVSRWRFQPATCHSFWGEAGLCIGTPALFRRSLDRFLPGTASYCVSTNSLTDLAYADNVAPLDATVSKRESSLDHSESMASHLGLHVSWQKTKPQHFVPDLTQTALQLQSWMNSLTLVSHSMISARYRKSPLCSNYQLIVHTKLTHLKITNVLHLLRSYSNLNAFKWHWTYQDY